MASACRHWVQSLVAAAVAVAGVHDCCCDSWASGVEVAVEANRRQPQQLDGDASVPGDADGCRSWRRSWPR